MRMDLDRHAVPRVADSWTFLYAEHVKVEQEEHAVALVDASGRIPVPVAALSSLLLGPGTSITHAAMCNLGRGDCTAVFVGAGGSRVYAHGAASDRRAALLMEQASQWADSERRIRVVRRMYTQRFDEELPEGLTLEQIRGREGVRVRDSYAAAAKRTGVPWRGRNYKRGDLAKSDPINRALSMANAILYGLCHSALITAGFSPGLGFIHTGKHLSLVYDVADIFKTTTTIPAAFQVVAEGSSDLRGRLRRKVREQCLQAKVLERVIPSLEYALGLRESRASLYHHRVPDAIDPGLVELWDPNGSIAGGQRHGER